VWYPKYTPKQWQYIEVVQQDYDSGILGGMRKRKPGIIPYAAYKKQRVAHP
jgi:hypothetical protein